MQPFGSPNNANVLTIDVPPQWAGTVPEKSTGPNLWVRTGCPLRSHDEPSPVRNRRLRWPVRLQL